MSSTTSAAATASSRSASSGSRHPKRLPKNRRSRHGRRRAGTVSYQTIRVRTRAGALRIRQPLPNTPNAKNRNSPRGIAVIGTAPSGTISRKQP
nr:MAG TPA_asm: hypothetical protein [Caudoviricetes sp.]